MRIWLAVIKRICSKDNTLSAFMGHKEKGLLNLNLKEKKVTAVASHGKNHNSKIVHKGSATRHSCVDFFFFSSRTGSNSSLFHDVCCFCFYPGFRQFHLASQISEPTGYFSYS